MTATTTPSAPGPAYALVLIALALEAITRHLLVLLVAPHGGRVEA